MVKGKGKTLDQFEQAFGGGRVRELQKQVRAMAEQRHNIQIEAPKGSNTIRFGVIGDTHFGSLYEAKDELQAFYELLKDEGIKTVLCAGDVIDGHRVYPGHEYEIHRLGWKAQSEWFRDTAPLIKGIDTYFITGNHDESFKRAAGINVGELLQDIRSDWHFLGEGKGGRIVLSADNGVSADIMMMHPRGNPPYALSYRLQKIIESLEGGNKPQLLITGHYHKSEILPTYRNVCGLQSGCFQWQTPFLAELGSPAHVGGWIIEVTPQTKTNGNIFKMQFVAFYNTKK
jgi:predicted phosphodiesterase